MIPTISLSLSLLLLPLLPLLSLLSLLPSLACAATSRSDLIGVYTLHPSTDQLANPALCPANMTVDTFQFAVSSSPRRIEHPEQFNIEIPHDVTTLAGRACDSAGAIDALESGHPFAADVSNILATWARAEWASERFMGEVAKQDWNIGYDFLPRTCRDVNLPSFVGYLWFQPGWDLILGDGFQLMGGTKYLFLNFLGRSKYGCVYIAKDTGDEDNPGPVSDPSLGEEGGDDATSESEEESDGEDDAEDDSEDGTATDDDSSSSTGDSNPESEPAEQPAEGNDSEGDDSEGEDSEGDDSDGNDSEDDDGNPDSAFNTDNRPPVGEDDQPACFPADATVHLADGSKIAMRDLGLGHAVHEASGKTSDIYFFSHRQHDGTHEFVSLRTESGNTVRLSAGHYVRTAKGLVAAGAVRRGDLLMLSTGRESKVTEVAKVWGVGRFAPHTMGGDIVVNGVLVSTYTTAVHPVLAHVLLAPMRMLHRAGKAQWAEGLLDGGGEWIRTIMPRGRDVVQVSRWGMQA